MKEIINANKNLAGKHLTQTLFLDLREWSVTV
jgi:hypothetical protein